MEETSGSCFAFNIWQHLGFGTSQPGGAGAHGGSFFCCAVASVSSAVKFNYRCNSLLRRCRARRVRQLLEFYPAKGRKECTVSTETLPLQSAVTRCLLQ